VFPSAAYLPHCSLPFQKLQRTLVWLGSKWSMASRSPRWCSLS
jgi:hypothetical protein